MLSNASYTRFIFGKFFICTIIWYAFYMHPYVDIFFYSCKKWVLQCLTPHRHFAIVERCRRRLPCTMSPAVPFCFGRVPYPSLVPLRTTLPHLIQWWLESAGEPPAGKGGRSPLLPIWVGQFRPRWTMLFFILPNDLFKFNSFMNSNFWNL
jgi:hypothetical protein